MAEERKGDGDVSPSKAMYILQVNREKLTEESMRTLKCLLLHILRTTQLQHIVIEIYLDE